MRLSPLPLLPAAAVAALALTGCDGSRGDDLLVFDPRTGPTTTFNVSLDGCDGAPVTRAFTRVTETAHAVLWTDNQNPSPTLAAADFKAIADSFEAIVYPTNVRIFGAPSDIDRNGKVHIVYTTAVNALSPANSASYIGGFFYGRDLLPRVSGKVDGGTRIISFGDNATCPGSNQAEMFYMLAPDANGTVNNNRRSLDLVRRLTLGTIAHEFQHLVNASTRVYVTNQPAFEELWLDEGLSHVAEEYAFYTAGGAAPGQNLDVTTIRLPETRRNAFNRLMLQNTARYRAFLRKGPAASPYDTNDSLYTRGAAWSFLRYAADRKGGDHEAFFRSLVRANAVGMDNLRAALGADPYPFVRDWHTSAFADDLVPVAAPYTQPSWNFRNILTTLYAAPYPLLTTTLTAGATSTANVVGGAAAHFRTAVAAGTQGTVRVTGDGTLPTAACGTGATAVALAVGGVQTLPAGPVALCLAGDAEYDLVAFHGSAAQVRTAQGSYPPSETLTVTASATGVVAPVLAGRVAAKTDAADPLLAAEAGRWAIERRIRLSERETFARMLPGSGRSPAPAFTRLGTDAASDLVVTVVRTR